jgi:REP element-mobilizing transposase RayT
MGIKDIPHSKLLGSGWNTRGYLPHYDGAAIPQFITFNLADALPATVIDRWQRQLTTLDDKEKKIIMQRRIDRYLDQGFGNCYLRNPEIATMVQESLLKEDGTSYELFAWVVMPNHTHSLLRRFEDTNIASILEAHKGATAHEANKVLQRSGQFWREEYFDRYIRNEEHFWNTFRYIENNPVRAGLCREPSDWPFSSAWVRKHKKRD